MKSSVRNTIVMNVVYGVIALIPVAIVVVLVIEVLKLLGEVAKPLALHSRGAAALVVLAGLVLLVVVCFLVGMLIRTRLGATTFGAIENKYLKRLPVYEPIANILKGFAQKSEGYQPVLLTLFGPGTAVLGLLMEENADGTVTVFVPSAPTLAMGSVHIVEKARVMRLSGSFGDFSGCLSQWGTGSRKLLAEGTGSL